MHAFCSMQFVSSARARSSALLCLIVCVLYTSREALIGLQDRVALQILIRLRMSRALSRSVSHRHVAVVVVVVVVVALYHWQHLIHGLNYVSVLQRANEIKTSACVCVSVCVCGTQSSVQSDINHFSCLCACFQLRRVYSLDCFVCLHVCLKHPSV